MHLCRFARRGSRVDDEVDRHEPTLAPRLNLQVQVPPGGQGPATIAGIAIPDAKLEQLRTNSTIELVLIDSTGAPNAIGRRFSAISSKIARSVALRDGHCRWPGCDARHALEIHHLVPRSLGGTDDVSNLAAVCSLLHHHEQLIPHGPYALVGNPNQPDGLRLLVYNDLFGRSPRVRPPAAAETTGVSAPEGQTWQAEQKNVERPDTRSRTTTWRQRGQAAPSRA